MRWKKLLEHPLTAFVPSAIVLAALAAAAGSTAMAPAGPLPRPLEMLGLLLAGTLAALYRPPWRRELLPGASEDAATAARDGALGIAALILPVALLRLGPFAASLLAGLVSFSARTWRHLATRRGAAGHGSPWPGRSAEDATLVAGAALLAGAVALPRTETEASTLGWQAAPGAAAYLAGLFVLLLLRRGALTPGGPRDLARWGRASLAVLAVLSLDAAGWTVGVLLYDSALAGGWIRVGPLMAAGALLAAEAARQDLKRRNTDLRVRDLERLQHAHRRILAEISGMGGIAQQILTECSNILPVHWFQFGQPQGDGSSRSWSAGPDGVLVEGDPAPEERPRILPGVHRRASWRILERELRAEGETLAVVRLWCDPRRIEPGAEELFSTLTPQMASSVHRAQLDREAKLDPLTGVPVRRMLEGGLQRAYRLCMEEGWSMAVIMCDVDHFKRINDNYGHAAGDEALKLFARTLDTHRRENDLCCRYGGEEFTLLLENTNGEAALYLAERLRQAVAALELELEGHLIPLTFSAGVAAFPELHIKTASELLLLADEALYEAKQQGRNRCLLNLGRGAFRAPAGPTIRSRQVPEPPPTPRVFG